MVLISERKIESFFSKKNLKYKLLFSGFLESGFPEIAFNRGGLVGGSHACNHRLPTLGWLTATQPPRASSQS